MRRRAKWGARGEGDGEGAIGDDEETFGTFGRRERTTAASCTRREGIFLSLQNFRGIKTSPQPRRVPPLSHSPPRSASRVQRVHSTLMDEDTRVDVPARRRPDVNDPQMMRRYRRPLGLDRRALDQAPLGPMPDRRFQAVAFVADQFVQALLAIDTKSEGAE